jgi:hypothetical protein
MLLAINPSHVLGISCATRLSELEVVVGFLFFSGVYLQEQGVL